MTSRLPLFALGLLALLPFGAVAQDDTAEPEPSLEEKLAEIPREYLRIPMTLEGLDQLIRSVDPEAQNAGGVWKFTARTPAEGSEIEMVVMTDTQADRMRILTQVAEIEDVTAEQLAECLKANYDRALDARYCVNQGALWSAFIHPLRDLTPELFFSAVSQVYNTRQSFGTDYSSGGIIFKHSEKYREDEKAAEETAKQGEKA